MKKCSKCKEIKDLDDFPIQSKEKNIYMSHCKKCRSIYNKKKRKDNIEEIRKKDKERYKNEAEKRRKYAREYRKKYPERTRATNWKVKFGITPEQYYEMLDNQKNKCAICGRDMYEYSRRIFCVDHNHITNKIRGLLCDPCNYGLGFYEKYKDKYREYLNKYDNESN